MTSSGPRPDTDVCEEHEVTQRSSHVSFYCHTHHISGEHP